MLDEGQTFRGEIVQDNMKVSEYQRGIKGKVSAGTLILLFQTP